MLAHRLRAGLAALGIVTGVATITAVLAIGDGARRQALEEIGQLGIDNVIVRGTTLDMEDTTDIARQFPRSTIALQRSTRDAVTADERATEATIAGVTPSWAATAGLTVERGRWLAAMDAERRTAVVGAALARSLALGADPIGQRVRAAGEWRTIVGVLASAQGASSLFVPIASLDLTLVKHDAGDALDQIVMKVPAGGDVIEAGASVRALLASRQRDRETAEVIVPLALLRARLQAQRTFDLLLLGIGALTLFVSGVGIMNIMVASVSERTTEIGVRRAFGARKSAIVFQFAAEAGVLSTAAGVAGISVGLAGVAIAAMLAGWHIAVTPQSVATAFALAVGVGVIAGVYPARLAARLTPSEALRAQQ